MKPKQFVKTLRSICEPEIVKHLAWCKKEAPGIFEDVDFKKFVKLSTKKTRNTKFDIRRSVIENWGRLGQYDYAPCTWLEFEIDGAQFKIANIPTSVSYVYRHANRAL